MINKLRIAGKAILYLLIGTFLIFVSLMFYVCFTTRIDYLIVESIEKNVTITPRFVSEFFLFNIRGSKKDIADLKMNDGGLHYVTSVLINSNLSKEKKAKYIHYFISKGCGVNDIFSFDGFGPLHGAAMFGDADTTELLLANGADPLLKSKSTVGFKNMTPLEIAELSQKKRSDIDYTKVIGLLRKAEEIRRHS
jgi:ankyrin repeat protein